MTMLKMLVITVLFGGGCSWGARSTHAVTALKCSSSLVWPSIDATIAGTSTGLVGYELARVRLGGPSEDRARLMGPAMMSAVVVGTAAISGFIWASDCRKLDARLPLARNP